MIKTDGRPLPVVKGQDCQNFDELQLVKGCYPYQIGLQQRIPGKSLIKIYPFPVRDIAVFYLVLGRPYRLTDYGTELEIEEVPLNPWEIPALPPFGNLWIDTFEDYSPIGLISRFWGAGIWPTEVGIVESLIEGWIDPFAVFATINTEAINLEDVPIQVDDDSGLTIPNDDGVGFTYPVHPPDIVLRRVFGNSDNSCIGQGTVPTEALDYINIYDYEFGPVVSTLVVNSMAVGARQTISGVTIGRMTDHSPASPPGYLVFSTNCIGYGAPWNTEPVMPPANIYHIYQYTGAFGPGPG